ncbi:hypothetical protein K5D42_24990 [Pseudomonas cichorii]|nr:hypothetical protein [Pseudomonas cichorii]MBX8493129.1 hypothetical protein [Pseudomonas cichorii]
MKGSSVYITAQELEALNDVTGYLSAILEGADDATHLIAAKAGLHSVIEKAQKSMRSAARRSTIKAALRSAENT